MVASFEISQGGSETRNPPSARDRPTETKSAGMSGANQPNRQTEAGPVFTQNSHITLTTIILTGIKLVREKSGGIESLKA